MTRKLKNFDDEFTTWEYLDKNGRSKGPPNLRIQYDYSVNNPDNTIQSPTTYCDNCQFIDEDNYCCKRYNWIMIKDKRIKNKLKDFWNEYHDEKLHCICDAYENINIYEQYKKTYKQQHKKKFPLRIMIFISLSIIIVGFMFLAQYIKL